MGLIMSLPKYMSISLSPVCVNITSLENSVFAHVNHSGSWGDIILNSGWTWNTMTGVFIRKKRGNFSIGTHRKTIWSWSQRLELCCHKWGNARCHQKLEKAKKDSLPEILEGVSPWWYFDLRFLDSRTMTEQISLVLSHPICGS